MEKRLRGRNKIEKKHNIYWKEEHQGEKKEERTEREKERRQRED